MTKTETETLVLEGILLGMEKANDKITEEEYETRKNYLLNKIKDEI